MKALVVGTTGLVGSELLRLLNNSPEFTRITTFSRRPPAIESPKIKSIVVDFEDLDDHSEEFSGDVLFSCLGTTKKAAGSLRSQRRVDVDYQVHAAHLARWHNVPHYILVSSSGASSASNNAYLRMKGELEDSICGMGFTSTTILQPSLLLGKRSKMRLLESFGKVILTPLCALPRLRRYRPIKASVVAQKMLDVALGNPHGFHKFKADRIFPGKKPA